MKYALATARIIPRRSEDLMARKLSARPKSTRRRVAVCPRILPRAKTLLPIIEGDQGSKSRAQLAAQCARTITPFPVSADRAGKIHPRCAAQPQHILQRDNRNVSDRRQHRPDHDPVDLGIIMEVEICTREVMFFADIVESARAVAGARTRPPAQRRVIVMSTGVGDQVTTVVMRTKRWTLRIGAERELQQTHAGQTELQPQFLHRRSNDAQVLRHNRQSAQMRSAVPTENLLRAL